ncbi:hypothetical protein CLCR_05313 [Cladophialophora carrionii]|uniref:Uncharacterized protein n=1 Tax=Cladophialophora carrionii TaxID=86049 RepID=A0A1C1CKS2_9EURO|nr:hypothetical protein CLCR_05313 [Cladophialophora carrionii]
MCVLSKSGQAGLDNILNMHQARNLSRPSAAKHEVVCEWEGMEASSPPSFSTTSESQFREHDRGLPPRNAGLRQR